MTRLLKLSVLIALLASVVNSISVMGAEIQLTQGTKVALADQHDSASELRKVDSFIKRLSPFDRAARMKTDKPVSQDEFLRFISAQAQPWTPDEAQRLTSINHSVAAKLNPLHLPFPPLVKFIKTTGLEEGRAAYCRGNCVVLPVNELHADNRARFPRTDWCQYWIYNSSRRSTCR